MNPPNLSLRILGLALATSAVVLVGCGGNEPPASSSSTSSSSSSSLSSSSSSEAIPNDATLVYAINVGGPSVTMDGVEYQADRFASGGTISSTTDPISEASQPALYQSERFGSSTYEIPVTNASYSVELHFVEMFQTMDGARQFSVTVEGQPVLQNFDLFAEAGHDVAYDVIEPQILVADGSLTITMTSQIDNATLSGFAIFSDDGGEFVEPPIPEPGETVPSMGCGTPQTIQNGRINLNVAGSNRSYILRVPENYNNQMPYRLVMAYHWGDGEASQVANGAGSTEDPFYGLWDLAEDSTIFVAPEGITRGWANTGGRDLALTDTILADLKADLCIDTSRIFALGFSFGASMSNAVACSRADVFRGVALYAGALLSGCDGGTAPIAYLGVHGLSDSVLDISLGRTIRDRFARNNGCSATSTPEPASGSGTHICTSYQGCDEGYPVRWCAFDGDHNPTEKDRGQAKSWIPVETWDFISQF